MKETFCGNISSSSGAGTLEWIRCDGGMPAGVMSLDDETESREFCLENETGADCVGVVTSGSGIRRLPRAASLCATDNVGVDVDDDGALPMDVFAANGEEALGPS